MKLDLSLYLVTDRRFSQHGSLDRQVGLAIEGGVTVVQLRDKTATTDDLFHAAEGLLKVLEPYKVPLIINDHVALARQVGAQGVHLGQSDMNPKVAREFLGTNAIIGLSIESFDNLKNVPADIDYLAASPVFATPTKLDIAPPFGLEGLRRLRVACTKPLIAIGGISGENIKDVLAQGVDGVAVVSAILGAEDPKEAASNLSAIIKKFRVKS